MSQRNLINFNSPTYFPASIFCENPNAKRFCHIGVHNSANRNAGDTLLFPVVRQIFDVVLGPFNWKLQQAWEEFTPDTVTEINASCDGVILGGGGLLLRDQVGCEHSSSGWQWNSSIVAVKRLAVPLVIFAIGYNRFPGQPDFEQVFTDHIRAVVYKANFLGLRNTGSIQAVKKYIEPELAYKLRRQYCPTTVIWQIYSQHRTKAMQHDRQNRRVFVFNAAFDRPSFRFGTQINEVLERIVGTVLMAERQGWEIVVAAHKSMDRNIEPYLDAAGVTYDTVDLTEANPEQIMDFYAAVDLVFGMRGHAQMIPFGLRRPIMSIISHNKMRFFLEDIGHLDWGVEIDDPDMGDKLMRMLTRLETDRASVHKDIVQAQKMVWEETQTNLATIGNELLGITVNTKNQ